MSRAYGLLKSKIKKTEDGRTTLTHEELEEMVYAKYEDGSLGFEEYDELCRQIDLIFS